MITPHDLAADAAVALVVCVEQLSPADRARVVGARDPWRALTRLSVERGRWPAEQAAQLAWAPLFGWCELIRLDAFDLVRRALVEVDEAGIEGAAELAAGMGGAHA